MLSSMAIPSSQASLPAQIPSLQIVRQFEGEIVLPPEQDHPGTSPEQSDLHFERLSRSPSSQVSKG